MQFQISSTEKFLVKNLSELYLRFKRFILLVELWQQQKQLKTMEMSEA